ncbi:hypothetical protein COV20_00860 [Candidatus Woesearchaeota archaeon CG10_big_fil_rev_8_21_14_0_10_45_16]|nr:MAG: hypothetical protein COV20_00860 [Candidatus Woesearchaeota archaeon CG10_big_fil_rev_8_21_14_0_10_45_16]
MKIVLVYLPFCTPVSPPYSLTNLQAFLSHNSSHEIKVLDLNVKFHHYKFQDAQEYFRSGQWNDYEEVAQKYHDLTRKVYSENNSQVVQSQKPEFFAEMLKSIEDEKPDIVAFSIVYSSQAFYAQALLKELKVTTVIGGPCVNKKLVADHHFKNELEFLDFLDRKDHSELKFDFPLDFSTDGYFTPQPVIPLKTSTTCYYQQCSFCAHYAKVPYLEYPLKTIEETVVKSQAKHFFLIDDMIPLRRLLLLAEIFKKHGAKWACQLRPTKEFTFEKLSELSASGLTFVLWGFESGSQKVLDLIKKGTKVEDIQEVLKDSSKAGIKNVLYTMFGFPGETKDDLLETIRFLQDNSENIDLVSISTFGVHKGAPVYDDPEKFGLVLKEEERTVLEPKITYTVKDGLSAAEVKMLRKKYGPVIDKINKYPASLNFFREHLFFYRNQ